MGVAMRRLAAFSLGIALSLSGAVFAQVFHLFQPGGDLAGVGSTWNSQVIANNAITTAKINNGAVDLTTKVTNTLPVGNGGTGATSITGLVLGNGASAMTAYAGTSCTNQFPRSLSSSGVATCATVQNTDLAAGVFANPSALVGLTAVNGSATTAMRSDGAPALDQSIAPTWTGLHVFSKNTQFTAVGASGSTDTTRQTVLLTNTLPLLGWKSTGSGADAKYWEEFAGGNTLKMQTVTDDLLTAAREFVVVTRSGVAVTDISFGNTTDNPTYTFKGTNGGIKADLAGTTGSIGGGALAAGACTSGTVSITGATTSMVAVASPNTYPGDGAVWDAQVTAAGTGTVKVCAIVALTPTASTYNVRVIQ